MDTQEDAVSGVPREVVQDKERVEVIVGARRGIDGADEFRRLLDDSLARGTRLVTEDDRHRIVDVRPVDREIRLPKDLPTRRPGPPWLPERLRAHVVDRGVRLPSVAAALPVSKARAREVFDAMALLSYEPVMVPAPCVPFRYLVCQGPLVSAQVRS